VVGGGGEERLGRGSEEGGYIQYSKERPYHSNMA
jgi:hypothetical protein